MTSVKDETIPMLFAREKPLLMVIDGHAMVHRSWHAISVQQHLSVGTTGEDITAVFGFTNTFLRAIQDWNPSHCAIAFDLPAPTFRHVQFPEYKAQRPPSPPELRSQFERVKQLMRAFNVPIFEREGYEADDIIGTICRNAEGQELETVILTGDTDTFQLVSPLVRVSLYRGFQDKKTYNENEILARYGGLTPVQQPDIKALKGDPSDNIPGVPGIGDKTAIKLILEFGSLEGLYENIDKVSPERVKEALIAHKEQALQGKELTTIRRDVPIELDVENFQFWNFRRQDVVDLLRELEFNTVVPRVPDPSVGTQQTAEGISPAPAKARSGSEDYRLVDREDKLEAMLEELSNAGQFAFDTETTNTDPMRADLVGLSFATAPGKAWYVPVGHREGEQVPVEQVLAKIKPVMEDPGVAKCAHNANYDLTVLGNYDFVPRNVDFDTMIAAHVLGKKALGLKNLALDVMGVEMTPISELLGTGRKQKTMDQVSIQDVTYYACADADYTGQLWAKFEDELHKQELRHILSQVEIPLLPILVTMQRHGIALDAGMLHEMSRNLNDQLTELVLEIYNSVGHTVNINSPQQLSDLLFNELQLPKTKRTKNGYSTDANSLEFLKDHHPVVSKILDYRQLSKLKSTYLDSLPELINPRTGRIHTSYNQTGSATGRVSSSDPNLQNIPIRTELGRQVRRAFVAENSPDWILMSADYSQIELRVLAHICKDQALVDAFGKDEDIHTTTGALMYEVPIDKVTSDMRRIAKVLNFGVIYGLSAYGIAQQTEFSPDQGQKFIDSYFASYPGIRDYVESTKKQARDLGYVSTLLGRRRYIPDIEASNMHVRQAAERIAINMPIQGTAADIIKLAMIRVHQRMEEQGLQSKMLLQVHDELLFELPNQEIESLQGIITDEMPAVLHLDVPLNVDIKMGASWGDLE